MKKIFGILKNRLFLFFALIAVQVTVLMLLLYVLQQSSMFVQAALTVLSLLLVLWIVTRKENPAYKTAWIILILLLPVFGILMYFCFSQRQLTKKERTLMLDTYQKTHRLMVSDKEMRGELRKLDVSVSRQSDYIETASIYPLYNNTQAKYYPMGEDFFQDLLTELSAAEHFIYLEYFIIEEGVMWDGVLRILEQKAQAGLDVRVIYDDAACLRTLPPDFIEKMREKGIPCVAFNPMRPILGSLFNNRDHRKIAVIDGHTGFCGGANLADEYINVRQRFGVWKDATVMIKGAAVWSLLMMFLHLWEFSTGEDVNFEAYQQYKIPSKPGEACGYVQPFADMPLDETYLSEGVFLNMIARAKDYIYINTPYLIPGYELVTALCTAAQSGVDVRITTPGIPDKKLVFMITQSYYPALLKAGAKIYEYSPGFIHSKTFVCDDELGLVGTINLDYRSLYLDFECGVWMYKLPCVADMKRDFLETAEQSREIVYADTQRLPWYKQFFVAILTVFAPLV
ncbi:MAG TPA: cardiolipin synthase [Clostridiales bacterium]|nr:cardiolipin synthase [Clostridiales bacterium]